MIDDLKLAISQNDLGKARRILKTKLFQREYPPQLLKDIIELVSSYDVFEIHNGEKFLPNSKEWTKEYLEKLKDDLDDNFSEERFMRAYYVARTIEKLENKNNKEISVCLNKHYKDFLKSAKIGVVVGGIATSITIIGIGLWIYTKKNKSNN